MIIHKVSATFIVQTKGKKDKINLFCSFQTCSFCFINLKAKSQKLKNNKKQELPGEKGRLGLNWYFPWTISTSGKFIPTLFTCTRTCEPFGARHLGTVSIS
jgi:hypothetical protein